MAAFSTPRGILPMLVAILALLQVAVAFQTAEQPVHRSPEAMDAHLEEMTQLLQERQIGGRLAITGVRGSVSPRLEIRDLNRNADQWNLFLLGMERFKAKSRTDRLSYYQIAGVHGRPFVTWNNFPTPLVNNAGFCPHGQTLFGTWHRPYLAVYEQAWYQSVQEVIATFPSNQQQRWRNAAATLRMPYWDWAKFPGSGQPAVPGLIRDQTVTVTKPQGRVSIANPLYSYSFGNSLPSELGGGPYGNFPATLRRPVPNPSRSNNNEMNTRFGSIRLSLRDRLFGLFMSGASWGYISTSQIGARTRQNGNNPDSVESIHDAIHVTAGGESGGHMYFLDYSSFDPIFWLHHTNVDRILAMYQIISPNTYVAIGRITRNMAQWSAGEEKNGNSPLKPFTKNTNGDYFTSDDVKNTRVLGYTYPETNGNPSASSIRSAVNNLYGPNAQNRKRSVDGQYEGRPFQDGDYQTIVSVIANKYALDGSYSIHCFLGGPSNSTNATAPFPTNSTSPHPSNSTSPYTNSTGDFTEDPNYVGNYAVLGGSKSGDKVVTEGCLPLTTALQGKEAKGELKSLHPDDVEPYLKEHLSYKIIGPGNVELEEVEDLHISVKAAPIYPADSYDELPSLGEFKTIPEVTIDKPCGKPYTHELTPIEVVTPGDHDEEYPEPSPSEPEPTKVPELQPSGTSPSHPTGTMVFPYPTAPEDEEGYCISKQIVNYVDPEGNFLYQEMS